MPHRLRVALVCTEWSSDASGGSTFEREVLRAVLSLGDAHDFVVYPDVPFARDIVRSVGAEDRVTFVAALGTPSLAARLRTRAGRLTGRIAPFRPFAELSDALVAARADCAWMFGGSLVPLDIPYVATIWDMRYRTHPWFPEVSAGGEWCERERLTAEFVRRGSIVLAGTEGGAREIRDAYGDLADSVRVVRMPTPAFALEEASAPLPALPEGVPGRFLLYPAHLWPHKNHVTAVRALASLGPRDPVSLVCTGSDRGTRAHVLRLAEELGVADRVHLAGFVSRATLVALYRHAEAVIHPSLFGPDNLPPLEAMALGCPVVAAAAPGGDEHFDGAAVLVGGLDAEGFAAAIRRLRDDLAHRDALIARGRLRAASQTPASYAAAVMRLIDERIAPVRSLWP